MIQIPKNDIQIIMQEVINALKAGCKASDEVIIETIELATDPSFYDVETV
ncbi:MAG: hypothetical protein WCJ60_04325 [bacterium]